MDYQLLIALLALAVAGYSAYLQRQQVKIMTGDQESLPGVGPSPWWRTPAVIAVFVLALLAWVPWVSNIIRAPTQPAIGVGGWGGFTPVSGMMPLSVVVNEANPNIKLMGIAFHYTGDTDFTDVSDLQKSALYDARKGTQIVMIKANSAFRGPRIIAADRQAPRIYPPIIPLCSRFDSVLFAPKMSAIASYGDFSRSPSLMKLHQGNILERITCCLPSPRNWKTRSFQRCGKLTP